MFIHILTISGTVPSVYSCLSTCDHFPCAQTVCNLYYAPAGDDVFQLLCIIRIFKFTLIFERCVCWVQNFRLAECLLALYISPLFSH